MSAVFHCFVALNMGKKYMDASIGLTTFLGQNYIDTEMDYSLQSDWLPCLLVLSDSGNAILKVRILFITES